MQNDELKAFVLRRINELGLKKYQVAERAQISRSNLYKILGGYTRNPRLDTVLALSRVLKVDTQDLLRRIANGR